MSAHSYARLRNYTAKTVVITVILSSAVVFSHWSVLQFVYSHCLHMFYFYCLLCLFRTTLFNLTLSSDNPFLIFVYKMLTNVWSCVNNTYNPQYKKITIEKIQTSANTMITWIHKHIHARYSTACCGVLSDIELLPSVPLASVEGHFSKIQLWENTVSTHHVQRSFRAWSQTSCTKGSYWMMIVFST